MRKYLIVAGLFLANNEIISVLALLILGAMFLASIFKEASDKGVSL